MLPTSEAAPEVVRRIERAGRALALGAAFIALLVLVGGWWLGVEGLRTWAPGLTSMKANTAVGILLVATALWLEIGRAAPNRRAVLVVSGAAVALALATLTEHLLDVRLGIDELFAVERGPNVAAGRMAPMTALSLLLLGSGAILHASSASRAQWAAQICALLATACGAAALAGYLYGVEVLYRAPGYVSLAPQTVIALVALGVASLCVRPREGVMRVYSASTTAGTFMRRLLPVIVLVPLVLGWLRLRGEELGLYQMRFGLALFVGVDVLTLLVLTWLAALRLHDVEVARRRDQEALAVSERSLAMAQRIAHIGSWEEDLVDPTDRSRAALRGSDELWRIFGTTAPDAAGGRAALLAAVHPDDRERVQAELTRAIRERTSFHARLRIRRADGEERRAETHAEVLYDDRGVPERVAGTVQDITDAARLEDALRLSKSRIRLIYDAVLDPTYLIEIDDDGAQRVASLNRAAESALGRPAREVVGVLLADISPGPAADRITAAVARAVAERRVVEYEAEADGPGGERRAYEIRTVPVLEGDAPVRHAVVVAHEVTARKRAEAMRARSADLELQIARMAEAGRAKSAFLANMSHELRTPLNAIIGFSELLHRGRVPIDAPEHQEFLGHIVSSGKHLLALLNDVLDLSRIDAGEIDLHPEPIRVGELVAEVCSVLGGAAQEKQIQVASEIEPTLDEVVVDPARLKQILFNYLSNALKFTPAGGRAVLRARAEDDARFRVEVEDTGVGIAPADMGRLFVDFQQLDSGTTKRHQGSGLGLALTKRLAELQGGSVGASSTPGVGSVFWVVLPRRP